MQVATTWMAAAAPPGAMESMAGMEHPVDTIAVPPLVTTRVLMQFCSAVAKCAAGSTPREHVDARIAELHGQIAILSNLACLTRLAVLGHPESFARLRDGLANLAAAVTPKDESPHTSRQQVGEPALDTSPPDYRVQFTTAVDLLGGAALVSKDDPAELDRMVRGVVVAIEAAIAYPVCFAAEAAAYLGEGTGELSAPHVASAIATATAGFLQDRRAGTPRLPHNVQRRLNSLAHDWIRANPVSEMFAALAGPSLDQIVHGIQPASAKIGDTITLMLRPSPGASSSAPVRDGTKSGGRTAPRHRFVLFCPSSCAEVLSAGEDALEVKVPYHAKSGPVIIVQAPDVADVVFLLQQYAEAYPLEWEYSVFSRIQVWQWAYPTAFAGPRVNIRQVPESVAVSAFTAAGPLAQGADVALGTPVYIHYTVDPPGSDAEEALQVQAPKGVVGRGSRPNMIVYTPTKAGRVVVRLKWGAVRESVSLRAVKANKSNAAT